MKGGKLSLIFPFFSQMRSLWTVLMFTIQIIIVLTYMRRVFDVSVQSTSRDESIHPKTSRRVHLTVRVVKNQTEWGEKTASPASIESDAQREKFVAFAVKENYIVMWEIWNETHSRAQKSLCLGTKSTRKRTQAIVSFRVIRFEQHFFSFIIERSKRNSMGSKEKKTRQRMRKWVNRVDEVDKVAPVVVSWEI